jgi:hypothetical protein
MDRSLCQQALRSVLSHFAQYKPSHGNVRLEALCDDQTGRYALLQCGWDGDERVLGVVVYATVDDEGIHIEEDGLEPGIITALLERGVPESAIDFPPFWPRRQPELQSNPVATAVA